MNLKFFATAFAIFAISCSTDRKNFKTPAVANSAEPQVLIAAPPLIKLMAVGTEIVQHSIEYNGSPTVKIGDSYQVRRKVNNTIETMQCQVIDLGTREEKGYNDQVVITITIETRRCSVVSHSDAKDGDTHEN